MLLLAGKMNFCASCSGAGVYTEVAVVLTLGLRDPGEGVKRLTGLVSPELLCECVSVCTWQGLSVRM